jgi:hypothetical protein
MKRPLDARGRSRLTALAFATAICSFPSESQACTIFVLTVSMALVERGEEGAQRIYYYRVEFANAIALQQFALDGERKLASGNLWVDVAWKSDANDGTH